MSMPTTPEEVAARSQARKSIPTNQAKQHTREDTKKLEGVAQAKTDHLAGEALRLLAAEEKATARRQSK